MNKLYGHLKVETAQIVNEELKPIRAKIEELLKDPKELEKILEKGAEKAKEKQVKL